MLVHQAYRREAAAIRSCARLTDGDAEALASMKEIERSLVATEAQDVAKLQAVYRAAAESRGEPVILEPPLTSEEEASTKLYPRPKAADPYVDFRAPGQPSMHPGRWQFALYDEEAKNFADGTRSILEIRDAISAEFGPIEVGKVVQFFTELERLGTWEISER